MKLVGAMASLVLSLACAAAGCGENPAPEWPTYASDIKPLMEAHCIRCHGAGGTLNDDPEITGLVKGAPTHGDFTKLDDDPKGTHGLLFYTSAGTGGAAQMKTYLTIGMPPPPSDPLTDRERTMLLDWASTPLLQ
ncbi:MAG TPA: hypothetical protein VHK47_02100 [Polyangia bacterium]|jgi:hypothetical protein|nr:hypothetical protein [Polyangia bacterium]